MKVEPGLGGRGTVVKVESKKHPRSHFEIKDMRVERASDGSFIIRHSMGLKKRHEGKDEYHGGYMEDEKHTAADGKELMSHILKHFGGSKAAKAAAEAEPNSEAEAEKGEE